MQEVGGSSPPVPTSLRAPLASFAAKAGTTRIEGAAGKPAKAVHRSCGPGERSASVDNFQFMAQVTITLPDGSQRSVPPGTAVREFASSALPQSVTRKALAAVVDGRMVDLSYPLAKDTSLRLVMPDGAEALALYRHS